MYGGSVVDNFYINYEASLPFVSSNIFFQGIQEKFLLERITEEHEERLIAEMKSK